MERSVPTVAELMRGDFTGSTDGFVFYPEKCREVFDYYDKDNNDHLDAQEILRLANVGDIHR